MSARRPTEQQIRACIEGILKGRNQTEIGKELGLPHNSMQLGKAYDAAVRHLERGEGGEIMAGRPGRSRNWNGKPSKARQRELRGLRQATELHKLSRRIADLCVVLEDFSIDDLRLDEATMWEIDAAYADMITLGEWWNRTIMGIQGWLSDVSVREKISKLRDTSGRTAEEAKVARMLADRLERKLEARLTAAG
jgi:hypothetical protein